MDVDVLGDAIGRDRRSSDVALCVPSVGRTYDYRRFCTSAWKVGNLLRHLGVRTGAGVAVADDPLPEPILTFYGAALLGGVVRFESPSAPSASGENRVLVVPAVDLDAYGDDPATKRVAYGDPPGDPTVAHFERDVWSENPTEPPDRVTTEDPLLCVSAPETGAVKTYTHGDVLAVAASVARSERLDADVEVAVRGSLTEPDVVAAGLVAPIVAGGTVSVGPDPSGETDPDVIVGGPKSDLDVGGLLSGDAPK